MKFRPAKISSPVGAYPVKVGRARPGKPHHIPNYAGMRNGAGFTLAEVLAALVFLAILIPVAIEGLSIASRAGEVAARKSEAAVVAEKLLNETIAASTWNQNQQNGTLRQGVREFRWRLQNEPWSQDPNQTAMRQVSVEVSFDVQGRDYALRMSTLVDGSGTVAQITPTQ